jgi:hypothetical protein
MSQHREWNFGTHRARSESSDLLVFRLEGSVGLADAREIVHVFQQVAYYGPVFAVVHLSNTSSTKEVRDYLSKNLRPRWFQAVVLTGANPMQKAALKALLISLYLTGWSVPVEFAETEAQASALTVRLRLQQKPRRAA